MIPRRACTYHTTFNTTPLKPVFSRGIQLEMSNTIIHTPIDDFVTDGDTILV